MSKNKNDFEILSEAIKNSHDEFENRMRQIILDHPNFNELCKIAIFLHNENEKNSDKEPRPYEYLTEGRKFYLLNQALVHYNSFILVNTALKE